MNSKKLKDSSSFWRQECKQGHNIDAERLVKSRGCRKSKTNYIGSFGCMRPHHACCIADQRQYICRPDDGWDSHY